jgi:hypothetical protein
MTKYLSADEKIALTYVRLAVTAISACMIRLPKNVDCRENAGRLGEHLVGLNEIECWLTGKEAPWKPTPSEERRVAIMARSLSDVVEVRDAAKMERLAAGLKRLAADTKRLEQAH